MTNIHDDVGAPATSEVGELQAGRGRSWWRVVLAIGFAVATVALAWCFWYFADLGRAGIAYYHETSSYFSDGFIATVELLMSGVAVVLGAVCLWNAIRFAVRFARQPAGATTAKRSWSSSTLALSFMYWTLLLGLASVFLVYLGRDSFLYAPPAPASFDDSVATAALIGSGAAGALALVCLWEAIRFWVRHRRERARL